MILQYATVNGHSLVLGQAAGGSQVTLPTGSEGVDAVSITFSGQSWDAFTTRKAQFWKDVSEIYETAIDSNGVAEIPEAILYTPGIIHFAVKGTDSQENVISTNDVIFAVCRGAFTSANAPAPSPSLFELAVQAAAAAIMAAVTEDIEEEIAEQIGDRVPDPTQADEFKFFRGDKTWAVPSGIRTNSERDFTTIPTTRITMDELLAKLARWYEEIDGKATGEAVSAKLDKFFGQENVGKVIGVGADGYAALFYPQIDGNETPEYIRRMVESGQHHSILVGTQYSIDHVTDVTAAVSGSGLTGASVDGAVFLGKTGEAKNTSYRFSYANRSWWNDAGDSVLLSDYGITYTGTPGSSSVITVTTTAKGMVLDAADHDTHCAEGENSLLLVSHDAVAYDLMPFSNPQLMICAVSAIPAGTYRFTVSHGAYNGGTGQDGVYAFTTGVSIPAGGGVRHSDLGKSGGGAVTSGTLTTYGAWDPENGAYRDVLESGITLEDITNDADKIAAYTSLGTVTSRDPQYKSDGTLSKVNFTERQYYGTNRYAHSNLRKWLNSAGAPLASGSASNWWTPSDDFDMPPAETERRLAGFLYGLEPSLVSSLGTAKIISELPRPDRTSGGSDRELLNDKVFLLSKTEVYGGNNIDTAEGSVLALFEDTDNSAKIKHNGSAVCYWWMRSASGSGAAYAREVRETGVADGNTVDRRYGIVPAMIIKP